MTKDAINLNKRKCDFLDAFENQFRMGLFWLTLESITACLILSSVRGTVDADAEEMRFRSLSDRGDNGNGTAPCKDELDDSGSSSSNLKVTVETGDDSAGIRKLDLERSRAVPFVSLRHCRMDRSLPNRATCPAGTEKERASNTEAAEELYVEDASSTELSDRGDGGAGAEGIKSDGDKFES